MGESLSDVCTYYTPESDPCNRVCDSLLAVTEQGDYVCFCVYRSVYVLFPPNGIVQIVKYRLLGGFSLLLFLHPHDSVFHDNIEGILECQHNADPNVSLHS